MILSTQPYKGARDFYPEDKRIQKFIFDTWREVVERYGYEEYDAPILEPLELYLAKTGEEIVNEQTYAFMDRGERRVAIRPEMTPTVSRMVAAKRQELAYPLRWFSIPNLWRYERPQRGRLREHWQLNVDLFGVAGIQAEHEMIQIADAIMKAFGAKWGTYTIKINSRKLVDYVFHDYLKLDETQSHMMSKLIDRMHKMDYAEFVAQVDGIFSPSQREEGAHQKLMAFLKVNSVSHLPEDLVGHESVTELQKLMQLLEGSKITNVHFDPTVMRGFDYYTDIVFEVFDNDPANNRSMFGGGRYDGLVALFGVEPVPTIGFGMGDVTLQNFLQTHGLLPQIKSETDLYVVLIGDIYEAAIDVLADLRDMEVNVAVDTSGRAAEKQIKSAVKKDVRYVLFIGEKELDQERYPLKDLKTGEEEAHSLQRIVSIVKDYRSK
jgi:histidyl-tRNA synthetase